MEIDVNSTESSSESSFESCVICLCSDEETENHDCNICTEGAWKVCKGCKDKLKRIDKCPVCMSVNINYEEEEEEEEIVRNDIRQNTVINLISQGLWKDALYKCLSIICKIFICIFYLFLGLSIVFFISISNKSIHCILIYFIGFSISFICFFIPFTLLYVPEDDLGQFYRQIFAPIILIILFTLISLINNHCIINLYSNLEILVISGIILLFYCCFTVRWLSSYT